MGLEADSPRSIYTLPLRLIQILAATIIVTIARCAALLDNLVQRMGTRSGLYHLPLFKEKPKKFRHNFNRLFFPFLLLAAFLLWNSHSNNVIIRSLEVPILGSKSSDVNLYFPPIGYDFQPEVPFYNEPPRVRARTPLFIPFTRNNTMMRQAVLSYIAAGWPREDIVLVDNSGTMDANNRGQLSSENAFFLDYDMYRRRYGVAILQTPTLLNFAQLQNFMLRQALARDWPFYFWSHMDVAILSAEDQSPYQSFYKRVLNVLYKSGLDAYATKAPEAALSDEYEEEEDEVDDEEAAELHGTSQVTDWAEQDNGQGRFKAILDKAVERVAPGKSKRHLEKRWPSRSLDWAVKFFDFDNLVLVNVEAWRKIGAWDTFIPYYNTDCDFYARLVMNGFKRNEVKTGYIFDVAGIIEDPEERFFPAKTPKSRLKWSTGLDGPEPLEGKLNSWRYRILKEQLAKMTSDKNSAKVGRNTWQDQAFSKPKQASEPWTYDARGFQTAWWATADYGRYMYVQKWGTNECNLVAKTNKTLDDAWKFQYMTENTPEWTARKAEEAKWKAYLDEGPIR